MEGLNLIEPTELYNLINRKETHPCISDPNYILILDARLKEEYNESHIFISKKAPKNDKDEFQVPYDAELECKEHVIVYDGKTQSLKENTPAVQCALRMWQMGSRNQVRILRGGYELFSAVYPFLRTQEIIYMPRELDVHQTYPLELVPNSVYLGNWSHGNTAYIQKDLKIQCHVNCSMEPETFFKDPDHVLHIPVEDSHEADLYSKFETAMDFIDSCVRDGFAVLIFSEYGISRAATVAMAYLMYRKSWKLRSVFKFAKQVNPRIQPNRGFVKQLLDWEIELHGEKGATDIADPKY